MKTLKCIIGIIFINILISCSTTDYRDWISANEVKANIDLVESWINDAEVFKAAMNDTVNCVTPEYYNKPYKDWIIPFCNKELPIIQEKYSIDYIFGSFYEHEGPSPKRRHIFSVIIESNSSYRYEFWFIKNNNKWRLNFLKMQEKF